MNGSFVGLLGRLVISMGVVMAVMWMAAKVVKGRNLGGFGGLTAGRRSGPKPKIEILARRHPERLAEMRAAWETWDATMPPIPEEAGVRLVYGKKDMP